MYGENRIYAKSVDVPCPVSVHAEMQWQVKDILNIANYTKSPHYL